MDLTQAFTLIKENGKVTIWHWKDRVQVSLQHAGLFRNLDFTTLSTNESLSNLYLEIGSNLHQMIEEDLERDKQKKIRESKEWEEYRIKHGMRLD